MIYGKGKYRYKLVEGWARLPEKEAILDACSVFVDAKGRVVVLTRGSHPVMVFDGDGNFMSAWGSDLFTKVHSGCVGDDGSLFIVDADGHTVYKMSPQGEMLLQLGQKGVCSDTGFRLETLEKEGLPRALATIKQSAPPFNMPTDVFIHSSGDVFVADGYGNARIHRFSPEGRLLYSFGEPGGGPGQFRVPHAVWIDRHDHIWVADRENNRLQIFDINGIFLDQLKNFKRPCSLHIDEDDVVYVAELGRRVSVMTGEGKLLASLMCDEPDKEQAVLLAPHGLAVDLEGNIYVAEVAMGIAGIDRRGRAVQKFARVSKGE